MAVGMGGLNPRAQHAAELMCKLVRKISPCKSEINQHHPAGHGALE